MTSKSKMITVWVAFKGVDDNFRTESICGVGSTREIAEKMSRLHGQEPPVCREFLMDYLPPHPAGRTLWTVGLRQSNGEPFNCCQADCSHVNEPVFYSMDKANDAMWMTLWEVDASKAMEAVKARHAWLKARKAVGISQEEYVRMDLRLPKAWDID